MRSSPTTKYDYVASGTVWPSGDFSVGYRKVDWKGPGEADRRNTAQRIDDGVFAGEVSDARYRFLADYGHPGGVLQALDAEYFYSSEFGPEGAASPLDLTDGSNPHKRPNRPEKYGKLGMTGYGKKMVRSACALLERRYRGRLTFATVTMPTLPPEMRKALAECWPELVRQALQWLSRRLQRQRLPKAVCSVSEVQPARLQAGNGGYLHLHMVWPNRRVGKGHWSVDVMEFRAWLESFLIKRGLWCEGAWVNVDTQPVTKSAAAYLSKYMSKGGDTLEAFAAENGWQAVPGQWWNLTKEMRDAVKREIVKGQAVGEWLESMVNYLFHTSDASAFWSVRTVDMEHDGRFITVGYCGILKSEHQRFAAESFSETLEMAA